MSATRRAAAVSVEAVADDPVTRGTFPSQRFSRRSLLGGTLATGLAAAGLGAAVGSEAYAAATPAKGLGPNGALLAPGSRPSPIFPKEPTRCPRSSTSLC